MLVGKSRDTKADGITRELGRHVLEFTEMSRPKPRIITNEQVSLAQRKEEGDILVAKFAENKRKREEKEWDVFVRYYENEFFKDSKSTSKSLQDETRWLKWILERQFYYSKWNR
jgi:hypothetical protein